MRSLPGRGVSPRPRHHPPAGVGGGGTHPPRKATVTIDTTFWRWTGLFGTGHVTYAPGQLAKEGPFTNPARMIEDIMGHDPMPTLLDGRSESEFMASVWMHAGWWDSEVGHVHVECTSMP